MLRRVYETASGYEQVPTYDFANARLVISFGADFLGTWNSPVSQTQGYAKMRRGRPGIRGTLVQIEPRMSLTGASADEWIAIRPGTESVLALGLANAIFAQPHTAMYTAAYVAEHSGVPASRFESLVQMLKNVQPAVAVIAGAPLAQTNGLFQADAVKILNAAMGNSDSGLVSFTPQGEMKATRSLATFAADVLAGKNAPQVMLLDGVNAVHSTPPGWKVKDALARIPYIVSFGQFADDTSVMADLILPDHSALESWTDSRPESGTTARAIVTVAGPAMKPLHNTRATEDVLLDVAKKLKKPLGAVPRVSARCCKASVGGDEAWLFRPSRDGVEIKAKEHKAQRNFKAHEMSPQCSMALSHSTHFISCPSRPRPFSTAPPRISPGCRRCPIR